MKKLITLLFSSLCLTLLPISAMANENETAVDLEETATKDLEVIQETIEETYGSTANFEREGTLVFDEEGNAVFLMKKSNLRSFEVKSQNLMQEVKSNIENEAKVIVKESKYSTNDLVNLQNAVLEKLLSYNPQILSDGTADLSLSLTNQTLLLLSKGELPADLKKDLVASFGEDLHFEITDHIAVPEEEKGRFIGWNNLGGGLALKNQGVEGSNCSTGPVGKLNGNYYLLTAGHCFFPSGSMVYQYLEAVGQEYARANERGFDVGLIHVNSANTLSGGRLATNGILVSDYSLPGYDNSFNRTADVYEGLPVCKSGYRTNHTCGVVIEKYDHFVDSNGNVNAVTKVRGSGNDYSNRGDSGGATISNNTSAPGSHAILGTHAAGVDSNGETYGFFTRIVDTIRIYGIDIHVSSTPARINY